MNAHTSYEKRALAVMIVGLVIILASCEMMMEPDPTMATYQVVFSSNWSMENNGGTEFPGNPHFSPLIGAVHTSDFTIWAENGTATPGVELVAETGAIATLVTELEAKMTENKVSTIITDSDTAPPRMMMSATFDITEDQIVSLVTMLAPSPDWIVGVSRVKLFKDGAWLESMVFQLRVYDAGTDDGPSFMSPDADTDPQGTITKLAGNDAIGLQEAENKHIIGTMTFTLQQ